MCISTVSSVAMTFSLPYTLHSAYRFHLNVSDIWCGWFEEQRLVPSLLCPRQAPWKSQTLRITTGKQYLGTTNGRSTGGGKVHEMRFQKNRCQIFSRDYGDEKTLEICLQWFDLRQEHQPWEMLRTRLDIQRKLKFFNQILARNGIGFSTAAE